MILNRSPQPYEILQHPDLNPEKSHTNVYGNLPERDTPAIVLVEIKYVSTKIIRKIGMRQQSKKSFFTNHNADNLMIVGSDLKNHVPRDTEL